MTPLQSLRSYCLWCCGESAKEVRLCPSPKCVLYPYRLGTIPKGASRQLTKVIKSRCRECCERPKDCDAGKPYMMHPPCHLWPFRMGRNPNVSEETRQKLREHGKRLVRFPGSQPESGPRINPS